MEQAGRQTPYCYFTLTSMDNVQVKYALC